MEQYIPKSALIAEIESKRKYAQTLGDIAINSSMQQFYDGMKQGCIDILSTLDTLEVKEVDLDTEIMKYQREIYDRDTTVRDVAKYFFELGMVVSNKAQKGK